MLLNEVSEFAPTKLRELEKTFKVLKKSQNNKEARFNLIKQIKEFTKINEVVVYFDNNLNAGVVTIYKQNKLIDIIKSFFNIFKSKQNAIQPSKLKNITSVEESSEYIERIYIFIGKPLLKILTPAEVVAVLLHEFGHVYATSSALPDNLLMLLSNVLKFFLIGRPVVQYFTTSSPFSVLMILYMLVLTFLISGINFTQHVGEYRSDNFALKYGYGDELVLVLNKLNTKEIIRPGFVDKAKELLKKIVDIARTLFVPSAESAHPDTNKRIKSLEDQIFKEFKKIYPNHKELFDLIRADYKKQEVNFHV